MKIRMASKISKLVTVFFILLCSNYSYSAAPVITEGSTYHLFTPVNTPITFTLHATDADGDNLTWSNFQYYTQGDLRHWSAGGHTYTPPTSGNYDYTDSFSIRVSDGSSIDQITVTMHMYSILTHNIPVFRYFTAPALSNADVDTIFSDGVDILENYDFWGDVTCNIDLVRSGNVTTFTAGDGSIDSSAEMNALADGISLVNDITFCGSLGPNIIGCGNTPGNKIAVVEADLADILWLHELGHNQGLAHRDENNAIMAPIIDANNTMVNSTECNAYKNN